ncbi:MAG: anti-sigma regulatory factor [Firmicutes bacterium]|nr:anti-sigma regulatory factor [Bacillota bacterium]
MSNNIALHYDIDGKDFTMAGEASSSIKKVLGQLGISPDIIRRVAISVYEAEMNCVIHAGGGFADVVINPEKICITVSDNGPGIPDVELAMKEGYSTAPNSIRQLGFGAGMGLPNIKNYTDEIKIKTNVGKGTSVEMVIYIAGKQPNI